MDTTLFEGLLPPLSGYLGPLPRRTRKKSSVPKRRPRGRGWTSTSTPCFPGSTPYGAGSTGGLSPRATLLRTESPFLHRGLLKKGGLILSKRGPLSKVSIDSTSDRWRGRVRTTRTRTVEGYGTTLRARIITIPRPLFKIKYKVRPIRLRLFYFQSTTQESTWSSGPLPKGGHLPSCNKRETPLFSTCQDIREEPPRWDLGSWWSQGPSPRRHP